MLFQQYACETFDKKKEGCKFFRLTSSLAGKDSDPPAQSPSPHIVAVLVDKYGVWMDYFIKYLCTILGPSFMRCGWSRLS